MKKQGTMMEDILIYNYCFLSCGFRWNGREHSKTIIRPGQNDRLLR